MDGLEWEHVWARYERRWVLRDVSLRVDPGRMLYLVGPAGGGKTALLRAASGALPLTSGRIWLNGLPLRRPASAVLGSEERLPDSLSVERAMRCRLARAGLRGRLMDRRLRLALRTWDLEGCREARLRALSGSQRQRVRLALPWACPAPVWLLDNPTGLLDPEWRHAWPGLLNAWREREGGAVVVATNIPEEAMAADEAAIIHEGRVAAAGPPERLCRRGGAEEIVVRTLDDRSAAAALSQHLRLEAERRPDGLVLRVRRADDTLPGVLQTLGPQLETVWVRRPTMESAIARYTAAPPATDLPTQPPRELRAAR